MEIKLTNFIVYAEVTKKSVDVRAEGELINRIFHITSKKKNDLVHGRSVVKEQTNIFSRAQLSV